MKQTAKHPPVFRSLAWRIAVLTLALWIAAMGILTLCVASDMLVQMHSQLRLYLNSGTAMLRAPEKDDLLPGELELNMIRRLGDPYLVVDLDPLLPIVGDQHLKKRLDSDDRLWGKWGLQYGFEAAVLFCDEEGDPMIRTGDYLTFTYATEESWFSTDTAAGGKGYILLDELNGGTELADRMLTQWPIGGMSADVIFPVLRFTGHFEGNAFRPVTIDCGYVFQNGEPVRDISKLSRPEEKSKVQWENLFSSPEEGTAASETIYAWDAGGFNCPQKEITANGQHFDSLSQLLSQAVASGDPDSYSCDNLFSSVLIGSKACENAYSSYTVAVAIHCKPLQYAALRSIGVYLSSFALVSLFLLLILKRLKFHIAAPLERMARAAQFGSTISPAARYDEIRTLEEHHARTHQALAENKTELQQLRIALDYAKDAEERRKQLISNITHELKTPLAILHSYCECLQEDLPKETQAQYLQTVLEETEKMDAMVLQMLELSRLEAGKIRIASDSVSLLQLTNIIAERMKPLLEQRELRVEYGYTEDLTITADEARMEQVITNLLSNAQKYSTHGGIIRISTYRSGSSLDLNIENTAPHLSQEALEKVFDSFYRADTSRNTPGTGLGLALVKSIISLHGGTCSVKNTHQDDGSQAVQFGFTLPMK